MSEEIFDRVKPLIGDEGIELLQKTKVIILGIGGVGSWCAESLVRSGIGEITLVDYATISPSNINRQIQATISTVGMLKIDVLADRLRSITGKTKIITVKKLYNNDTATDFNLGYYDYIVDCIDTVPAKMLLISNSQAAKTTIFSSLGAASKSDPGRVRVAPLKDTYSCPLAKIIRKSARRRGLTQDFLTVFSDEHIQERHSDDSKIDTHSGFKTRINSSLNHITAMFGFSLAGLVFNDVIKNFGEINRVR